MQTTLAILPETETTIDRARAALREVLTGREYARLAPQLHLIERDRRILNTYQRLRKQGLSAEQAIYHLSDSFFLSTDRIDEIIYPRTRALKRVQQHV